MDHHIIKVFKSEEKSKMLEYCNRFKLAVGFSPRSSYGLDKTETYKHVFVYSVYVVGDKEYDAYKTAHAQGRI